MHTLVLLFSPTRNVSNFKSGFLIFLLINETLSTISSVNPSLGPFTTASVTGIETDLLINPFTSQYIIFSALSKQIIKSPDNTWSIPSSISFAIPAALISRNFVTTSSIELHELLIECKGSTTYSLI